MDALKTKPIVLVVDDSPDSLGMINTALEEAGLTVLVSLNGMQALSIIEQIEPTVVLMDAMMPGMDGFETCAKLKQSLPITPVIFMTGLTETEHKIAAFEAGGVDYITKPINPDELIARIRTHIANAQHISNARLALDSAKQFVIASDGTGNILWLTPQTRTVLHEAGATSGWIENEFQQQLAQWLVNAKPSSDLILKGLTTPLTIKYFKHATSGEHLLRLINHKNELTPAALSSNLPITKRESEVLYWLTQGKTNREIATILDMSHRTVNKHLEQIYPKLCVDNRTSAATAALKVLEAEAG